MLSNEYPGINRRTLNEVLEWCKEKYGMSKYHSDFPAYKLTKSLPPDMEGEYDPHKNLIIISKNQRSLRSTVSTFIHEYTHYMQNINKMYDVYYEKYGHNYDNHPYEIRARKVAERDTDTCIRQLFRRNNGKK